MIVRAWRNAATWFGCDRKHLPMPMKCVNDFQGSAWFDFVVQGSVFATLQIGLKTRICGGEASTNCSRQLLRADWGLPQPAEPESVTPKPFPGNCDRS